MELLVLLAALQVADVLTTVRFLKAGVPEANPIARKLFEVMGVIPAMVLLKGVFLYVTYITMATDYWHEVVIVVCVVYTAIVVRNWRAVK